MSEHKSTFEFVDEKTGEVVSAHRHVNPDGSVGGWVADTATVGAGAYVEPGALVLPGTIIPPGECVYAKDKRAFIFDPSEDEDLWVH